MGEWKDGRMAPLKNLIEAKSKAPSLNKCIKYLMYLDELYSSILRVTSRDEYLFLESAFLIPWLLAGRSWCRVRPAPLDQSELLSLKSNSQSPRGSPRACRANSD